MTAAGLAGSGTPTRRVALRHAPSIPLASSRLSRPTSEESDVHDHQDIRPVPKVFEAMNNPDWRRRPNATTSSESSSMSTSYRVATQNAGRWKRESPERDISHHDPSCTLKHPNPFDHIAVEPFHCSLTDETMSSEDELDTLQNIGTEVSEHYGVIRQTKIPKVFAGNRSMKLIDVVPLLPQHRTKPHRAALQQGTVCIQKFDKPPAAPSKDCSSSIADQIDAVVAASGRTPQKVRLSLGAPNASDGLRHDFVKEPERSTSQAKKAVLMNFAAAHEGGCYDVSKGNRAPKIKIQQYRAPSKENIRHEIHHSTPNGTSYQALLSKLNRSGVADKNIRESQHNMAPVERSCHTLPPPEALLRRDNAARQRVPHDSGYESGVSDPKGIADSRSDNFSRPMESQPSANAFNPKAREFLSLTDSPPKQGSASMDTSEPVFISEQNEARCEPDASTVNATPGSESQAAPAYGTFTGLSHSVWDNGTALPKPAEFDAGSHFLQRLAPVYPMPQMAPSHVFGVEPGFAMPFNNIGMPPGLKPPVMGASPTPFPTVPMPQYHAPQTISFTPPTPNLFPPPKPRVPNCKAQMSYEAYIEYRKATEPGYAMECKLRQQRRAGKCGSRGGSSMKA